MTSICPHFRSAVLAFAQKSRCNRYETVAVCKKTSHILWNPQYPKLCTTQGHQKFLHTHVNLLSDGTPRELDDITFDKLSEETLDDLAEFFEDLGDSGLCSSDYDVSLSAGVLTITVGAHHGTYVINKQSPNKQLWFSSPKSGPKRYDVIDGRWRYSHDGVALHDLLQKEFGEILDVEIDLSQLKYSHIISDEGNWAN